MAYDQAKLVHDVRLYLGEVSTDKLPEGTIIFFADMHDNNPTYTGKQNYITWQTTLSSLDFLRAASASSTSNAAKSSRTEKVGDVTVTETIDNSSASSTVVSYKDLYDDYKAHPEKFGIIITTGTGAVLINGVKQDLVDQYRNNTETTSIYNALPVTAFPKSSGVTYTRDAVRRSRR